MATTFLASGSSYGDGHLFLHSSSPSSSSSVSVSILVPSPFLSPSPSLFSSPSSFSPPFSSSPSFLSSSSSSSSSSSCCSSSSSFSPSLHLVPPLSQLQTLARAAAVSKGSCGCRAVRTAQPLLEDSHADNADNTDGYGYGYDYGYGCGYGYGYGRERVDGLRLGLQLTLPPVLHVEPDEPEFHVNVGYAIRTLREDLPTMFYKDLTYSIYRSDIVYRDPMNTFSGIENYKLIFWALRFHGRIFFKVLRVDVLRIWKPSDDTIMVRWQIRGIPRVPWEAQGIFDGISTYKLDRKGKIYEHKVDNVALSSWPKFKVPAVVDLVVGCSSTPKPTIYTEVQLLLWSLLHFTWFRYYLALKGTMDLTSG